MTRYIALLRAINVGRGRSVKMESLRKLFESLGFSKVATFIASGNVVFEATTVNVELLEKQIEKKLRAVFGYEVAVFIRTKAELAKIAKYKPFPQSKVETGTEFNIIFLAETLDEKVTRKVRALQTDTDEFHVHGREIYWLRRRKEGRSIFSTVPLEKALGRQFTVRGATTIKRMNLTFGCSVSLETKPT